MLEAEALKEIQQTAVDAAAVQVLQVPGHDQHVLIAQSGTNDLKELPPKPRDHEVHSLQDLVGACETFNASSLWICQEQVVAIIDEERRRDRIVWPLEFSDQMKLILESREPLLLDQPKFVRWLKVGMHGIVSDETLLVAVSSMEWKMRSEGHGEVGHGTQSLGHSVESEVKGKKATIPETFIVEPRVYGNREEEHTESIELSLDLNINQQKFVITALPEQLDRAIERTLAKMMERLQSKDAIKDVSIFFGKP